MKKLSENPESLQASVLKINKLIDKIKSTLDEMEESKGIKAKNTEEEGAPLPKKSYYKKVAKKKVGRKKKWGI